MWQLKPKQDEVKPTRKGSQIVHFLNEFPVTHQEGFFHVNVSVVQFFWRKHHTLMRSSWLTDWTYQLTNEDRGEWLIVIQWNSGTSLWLWLLVNWHYSIKGNCGHKFTNSDTRSSFVIMGICYTGVIIREVVGCYCMFGSHMCSSHFGH